MQTLSQSSSLSFCEEKLSGPDHNRMLSVCLSYYVKLSAARRKPGKTIPSHILKFHVQCIAIFKQESTKDQLQGKSLVDLTV